MANIDYYSDDKECKGLEFNFMPELNDWAYHIKFKGYD
jgi:hypothetical protein